MGGQMVINQKMDMIKTINQIWVMDQNQTKKVSTIKKEKMIKNILTINQINQMEADQTKMIMKTSLQNPKENDQTRKMKTNLQNPKENDQTRKMKTSLQNQAKKKMIIQAKMKQLTKTNLQNTNQQTSYPSLKLTIQLNKFKLHTPII